MAIDPNVGALKDYLTDITTSKTYNKLKGRSVEYAGQTFNVWQERTGNRVKS